MLDRPDIAYIYDGSWEGFLCCVFESYCMHELPAAILCTDQQQCMLYPQREIPTNAEKAKRTALGIARKISQQALELLQLAQLTCLDGKEMDCLLFVRLGFQTGRSVMAMETHDVVHRLQRAVGHLEREAQQCKQFIRFHEKQGVLIAVIEPKNHVLPLLEAHFADRYANESFFIYDQTHCEALAYQNGHSMIFALESFSPAADPDEELDYQALWQTFYNTIAVEGRINLRRRMSFMPKRFWKHIIEMEGDLYGKKNGRLPDCSLPMAQEPIKPLPERT